MASTDFGIPLDKNSQTNHKLDLNDDEASNFSNSSNRKENNESYLDRLRCWLHLMKLVQNSLRKFNQNEKFIPDLPLILIGFSKGCIVLNELCNELEFIDNVMRNEETSSIPNEVSTQLVDFFNRVDHLVWLDGGHFGQSNGWINKNEIINSIKKYDFKCYVYVTSYQMKSHKYLAIEEYKKFILLLQESGIKFKNIYYFEDEEDFDINTHFNLLNNFDICFF